MGGWEERREVKEVVVQRVEMSQGGWRLGHGDVEGGKGGRV